MLTIRAYCNTVIKAICFSVIGDHHHQVPCCLGCMLCFTCDLSVASIISAGVFLLSHCFRLQRLFYLNFSHASLLMCLSWVTMASNPPFRALCPMNHNCRWFMNLIKFVIAAIHSTLSTHLGNYISLASNSLFTAHDSLLCIRIIQRSIFSDI